MTGTQLKLEPIPSTVDKIMNELKAEAHLDSKKPVENAKKEEKAKIVEVKKPIEVK